MHQMAILSLMATMAVILISTVMVKTSLKFFYIGCYGNSYSYEKFGCNRHNSCNGHNSCNKYIGCNGHNSLNGFYSCNDIYLFIGSSSCIDYNWL